MDQRDKLWDTEATVKLIKIIEQLPLLWDTQNVDFRDIVKKRRTFTGIGAEFGCSGSQVERKWRDLLSQYRREKIQNNSMLDVTSWFAYDHMRFLDAQEALNITKPAPSPTASFAKTSNSYLQAYKWQRRKYPSASGAIADNEHWNPSKIYTPANVDNKNRDEFEIFGEGVAAKLRKIHDPTIQLCVQRDIDNTLYDALMTSGVTKLPLNGGINTNSRR